MTRKDYVKLAQVINDMYHGFYHDYNDFKIDVEECRYGQKAIAKLAGKLSDMLEDDNGRFSRDKWMEACLRD